MVLLIGKICNLVNMLPWKFALVPWYGTATVFARED